MSNNILKKIIDYYPDDTFLIADGFDDAIIGIDEITMKLIYSVSKSINILIMNGLTEEEAIEHFYFNVNGSYVGDKTPIWCYDIFDNESI